MAYLQQQHNQVTTGKRKREQGGSEGPENKKWAVEKPNVTKADSEDGWNVVGVMTQMTMSTHNQTQKDQPCCIQSVFRRDLKVEPGDAGGNLLKAESDKTLETIDVEFTGTVSSDPATEFHIEKSDEKKADVLRYRSGGDNYYLKVNKFGGVNLRKLIHFPTDDKYFFHIKRTGQDYEAPITIQSLKTKEYLHCLKGGRVFMNKVKAIVKGVPEDRETWFSYIKPSSEIQEQVVHYNKFKTVTVKETVVDVEDAGKNTECADTKKENSEEAQKQNLEYSEGESSKPVSGKEKCDDPGRGDSQYAEEEVNREGRKEETSREPKNRGLEDLAKENSSDMEQKRTSE